MQARGWPVTSIADHQASGSVFITTEALLIHSSSTSTMIDLSLKVSKKRANELDTS